MIFSLSLLFHNSPICTFDFEFLFFIFKESIAGKGVHPHSLCPINRTLILLKEIEESMLFIHHK